MQKKIIILLAVFVVAFMFAGAASAASVQSNQITTAKNTVGTNTGQNIQQKSKINDPVNLRTLKTYSTIQAAINDPKTKNGDTIIVFSGVYNENVLVNKALILLAKGKVTVQAADPTQPVFTITSNKVTIQNFIIGPSKSDGILVQSNSNTLRDNTITSNYNGIDVQNARSNNIKNNNINNIGNNGIELDSSNLNFVTSNTVSVLGRYGIFLQNSNFNTIGNNVATSYNGWAIRLENSNGNTIQDNTVSNAYVGIGIFLNSNYNIIESNDISNSYFGIALEENTNYNTLRYNTATYNVYGIWLGTYSSSPPHDNTITDNTVQYNTADGLYLYNSNNNNIQRNTITDNAGYGVNLLNSSNFNTIAYNNLTPNGLGNINEDGTSTNNNIHDNT